MADLRPPPSLLRHYLKHCAVDSASLHALLLKTARLFLHIPLCNALVSAYASRRLLSHARKLFDEMPHTNPFTRSAIASAHAVAGDLAGALRAMDRPDAREDHSGEPPSPLPAKLMLGSILRACTLSGDLGTGIQLHCRALKLGVACDTFVAGTLIDFYGKCGAAEDSMRALACAEERNAFVWTAVIAGFAGCERKELRDCTFGLFRDMIRDEIGPMDMTFTSLARTFDGPAALGRAWQMHGCLVKSGVPVDEILQSTMIAMYGRCGAVDEAARLSSTACTMDAVSWTSLLVAYVQNGLDPEAIRTFREMVDADVTVDPHVVCSILGACFATGGLASGKEMHGYAERRGFMSDLSIGNAFITLYGRCGEIMRAETVFCHLSERDEVSWTALLACYEKSGLGDKAVSLFREMQEEYPIQSPFPVTKMVGLSSAMLSLSLGEQMHSLAVKMGLGGEISVQNSLIAMYGKCGYVHGAISVFDSMCSRDLISYNAMITVFSQHGLVEEALRLFHGLQYEGLEPDDYTFLGVLASCSHCGMVDVGFQYFNSMSAVHGLEPKMEHYACMVNLLGRARRLPDAMKFINAMPCEPNYLVWESLLASCLFNRNTELVEVASEKILQMKPDSPSVYSILSNIHAWMGMWDAKACVLSTMKSRGIRKEPSRSWVEVKGTLHVFAADDDSHPQAHLIDRKLEELKSKMTEMGYRPHRKLVLQDVEHEQKDSSLLHHSEKKALAFALLVTAKGTPIRIMQNLRCCGDCHSAFEIISLIEDRYVVLRDAKRFHHFKGGKCSCNTAYW